MKVLKPGREQKGWSMEATCTGRGNGEGGCGAELLVEEDDIYRTVSGHYDGSTDYYETFKCSECGVETDFKTGIVPSKVVDKILKKKKEEQENAN